MNLRTTPLLCGLLLGMLWLFGLMLAYKRGVPDESFIVPSLNEPDVKTDKIDSVKLEFAPDKEKEQPDVLFVQDDGYWYLQQKDQRVRVEGFRVKKLVDQVRDAKRYEEEAVSQDLADKGLTTPRITVTLKGKAKDQEKTWKLFVGTESADKFTAYVNSSDRPGRAFPVARASLDTLFFKDANSFRSQRLFDSANESSTNLIEMKKDQHELALKKTDAGTWAFLKPKEMGFADFEASAPAPAADPKFPEKREPEGAASRASSRPSARSRSRTRPTSSRSAPTSPATASRRGRSRRR